MRRAVPECQSYMLIEANELRGDRLPFRSEQNELFRCQHVTVRMQPDEPERFERADQKPDLCLVGVAPL